MKNQHSKKRFPEKRKYLQRTDKGRAAILLFVCIFLCLFILPAWSGRVKAAQNTEEQQQAPKEDAQDLKEEPAGESAVYEELKLYAQAAVLIDGATERILYEKNAHELLPNASTTKILTCILAIENGDLDQVCTVSAYACTMPETKCGFAKGETLYLKDLLYSLMLESHNDSAVVIAEAIGGDVEHFAQMMNEKAKEIGCETYHFVTPNGLDGEDEQGSHGISAYDLAKIMNYCRKNETFLTITRAANHSFSNVDGTKDYTVNNKNSFLNMQSGVLSGKTGYTSKAGYCYVCSYEENGRDYSLALLACGWPNHKSYKWSDAKQLIAYGNHYFQIRDISKQEVDEQLSVSGGIQAEGSTYRFPERVRLYAKEEPLQVLIGDKDEVTTKVKLGKPSVSSIKKGDEVGVMDYYINGSYAGSQQLYAGEDVLKFDYRWCIGFVLKGFLQNALV